MILTKDILTKTAKKGRLEAVNLLNQLSRVGRLPEPYYEYRPGGYAKKRLHYFKVRFRIPQFLQEQMQDMMGHTVIGQGRCRQKPFSKTLAALEVVHQLEQGLNVKRGQLQSKLDEYLEQESAKLSTIERLPVDEAVPNISWNNLPLDPAFPETQPASRRGRIDFFPAIVQDANAFMAAKACTLTSVQRLPALVHQGNQTDEGIIQKWANIRMVGRIRGWSNALSPEDMGTTVQDAEYISFASLADSIRKKNEKSNQLGDIVEMASGSSSFGMAKLFVAWPKHHFQPMKELLEKVQSKRKSMEENQQPTMQHHRPRNQTLSTTGEQLLKPRLESFRRHQKKTPLPIDSVESSIPHDAEVVIVRGGTGSGKTTRYPLMLSLTSPNNNTRVMVAQPRRLACQTASRRVASEQDTQIGQSDCPIGYAVRFESFLSKAQNRTVDFVTPGVLLRMATNDPLLGDITHLCIDEVHERNADIDLLQALAKEAQEQRLNHPTLPPLQITLMSATLDSDQWEKYFDKRNVKVVDAPDIRRFPIDVVHIDDDNFPSPKYTDWLNRKKNYPDYDDALCKAMAELVIHTYNNELSDGSILCFLPGMDEIRFVEHMIKKSSPKGSPYITIRHLHSSVSSKDQAKAFEPGRKVILSTNIAETSVTIPDVKIVIDSGRERQFSLLDSVSESTTVVGSQLVTIGISQASAKQRAGRAGRVSAGKCYRLYTRDHHDSMEPYTKPEMLRMDLSQLVLHSLSLFSPVMGHPLTLLRMAPDPPSEPQLKQTLAGLSSKGLVIGQGPALRMTPLGEAVSTIPATPQVARMIFLGLAIRAFEPALTIASLLSIPKVLSFKSRPNNQDPTETLDMPCSDIAVHMQEYEKYIALPPREKSSHMRRIQFDQVSKVRRQLVSAFERYTKTRPREDWNLNSNRLGAQASLICSSSPHIAHLVTGKNFLATRDVAGEALIHPSSVNFDNATRVHWYTYYELRTTRAPYLHVTTAASPLELALYSDCDVSLGETEDVKFGTDKLEFAEWLFIADQWVPVAASASNQQETIWNLKRWLTYELLQDVVQDPARIGGDPDHATLVQYVISAIEQQRVKL